MNEQMLIQHILKYLAECEYERSELSLELLSEKLAIGPSQAEQVLSNLQEAGLVQSEAVAGKKQISLTASGREYAMHVLKAHRLYETYLARTTGLPESSWHKLADAAEHELTESDVKRLAEELGNPRFDPHGDPIPTRTGKMPEKQGKLLTEYPAGWSGRVVHIEDEPANLYERISQARIAPDTVLRIEKKTACELELNIEGERYVFPQEVAGQISAVELAEGEQFDSSIERLARLKPGEQADIISLSPLCRGLERNRLLDLGFVPGSRITVDLINPSGSPIAYRVRGACIALRREQTERIRIRKVCKAK